MVNPAEMADDYFRHFEVAAATGPVDQLLRIADVLWRTCLSGGTIYVFGNGACASLAAHMATDLSKGTATDVGASLQVPSNLRLRAVSLSDNTASLTAYGNDIGYEWVFVEQLRTLLRPGDVVLAASGSGASPNVMRALDYAALLDVTRVGFTGQQPTAVELMTRCDLTVQAPSDRIDQIEDWHVVYNHILTMLLRERLREHDTA